MLKHRDLKSLFAAFLAPVLSQSIQEITLISNVLEDHTVRSLPDHDQCLTTVYAKSGNNHLELVPCAPYGFETITEDMLFKYDIENDMVKSFVDEQCWNVNNAKKTLSLKPCHTTKVRSDHSKQAFHVMNNGTGFGAMVPGGEYSGMCAGYLLNHEQFRGGMKVISVFNCDMSAFELQM